VFLASSDVFSHFETLYGLVLAHIQKLIFSAVISSARDNYQIFIKAKLVIVVRDFRHTWRRGG
jgi:hypothetical protein